MTLPGSILKRVRRTDVWMPIEQEAYFVPQTRLFTSFDANDSQVHMWGRLKPGVSMKTAEQALLPLAQELAHEHPDVLQKDEHLKAAPGGYAANLGTDELPMFGLLSAMVLLILATACGNLGNLLLGRPSRASARSQHGWRWAPHAGGSSGSYLLKAFLLAAAGAALGLLLSWFASRALVVGLGGRTILTMLLTGGRSCLHSAGTLACLLAGLPPARQLARQKHQSSRARTLYGTASGGELCFAGGVCSAGPGHARRAEYRSWIQLCADHHGRSQPCMPTHSSQPRPGNTWTNLKNDQPGPGSGICKPGVESSDGQSRVRIQRGSTGR